jgi:CubicO group peptidase (beta-lactamase class C family)
MDPVNKIAAILFTNRVYPDANANSKGIQTVRQAFSNTILSVLGLSD